jgi:hypothetical protein
MSPEAEQNCPCHNPLDMARVSERPGINPLLALTYQNVLDLIVTCRAKRFQTYWHVRTFKCPLKKKRSLPAHALRIKIGPAKG